MSNYFKIDDNNWVNLDHIAYIQVNEMGKIKLYPHHQPNHPWIVGSGISDEIWVKLSLVAFNNCVQRLREYLKKQIA